MNPIQQAKPSEGPERARQVRTIFSEIAPRYDLLNHLLSLNVDRGWRRKAIDRLDWEAVPDGFYLDACAGTFDLSLELAGRAGFGGGVLASDFAFPMLLEGKPKLEGSRVLPVCGDTLELPVLLKSCLKRLRNLSRVHPGQPPEMRTFWAAPGRVRRRFMK